MTHGPGKYDEECTRLRESTDADVAIAVVLGGNRGNGFSVQARGMPVTAQLPKILRQVADQIEQDTDP